jgi:hypothetical protein
MPLSLLGSGDKSSFNVSPELSGGTWTMKPPVWDFRISPAHAT